MQMKLETNITHLILTSESHNLLWGNSRWGLTFRFANGCDAMDFQKLIKYMYYIFSKTTVIQKKLLIFNGISTPLNEFNINPGLRKLYSQHLHLLYNTSSE